MRATFVKALPVSDKSPQTTTNQSKATTPIKAHSRNVSGMTFSNVANREMGDKTPDSGRTGKRKITL